MLAGARVILLQLQLFRLGAWVLFGHVKITSVSCAHEFDLQGRWLRHDTYSLIEGLWTDRYQKTARKLG